MCPRILALVTGGLGDLLSAVPALLALRGELEIWGRPEFLPALDGCVGRIDRRSPFERPGVHLLFAPGERPPAAIAAAVAGVDLAVSFLGEPGGVLERSLLAAGARRVVTAAIPARDARGGPLAAIRIRDELAARAGLVLAPHEPLRIRPTAASCAAAAALLDRLGLANRDVLLVHPGSGNPAKNWPIDRFVRTARRASEEVGTATLFVTGPADAEVERRLAAEATAGARISSPPLDTLAALLARSRLYLGNDSGVSHLAAAAGAAGVAIFGPADPSAWSPDSDRIVAIRDGDDPATVSEERVRAALSEAMGRRR